MRVVALLLFVCALTASCIASNILVSSTGSDTSGCGSDTNSACGSLFYAISISSPRMMNRLMNLD